MATAGYRTPTRPKPSFQTASPAWGDQTLTGAEVAAQAMTDAAGKMSNLMANFTQQIDKLEKLSPAVDHSDCHGKNIGSASRPSPSPSTHGSPFYGFSTSDTASAVNPEPIFHYVQMNNPETGPGLLLPGITCGEQVPAPMAGSHLHHVYVDDDACLHDNEGGRDFNYRGTGGIRGVEAKFSSSEDDEEEIRVKETRDTIVTVGKSKKRTAKHAKLGKPPGSKRRN